MALARTYLALALFLAPLACASGDGMQMKLRDATSGYNRYLRWGDIDRAAEFLPPVSRNAFLESHEDVEDDLVIVEYNVTRLQIDKERGTATSRAELKWHTERRLILEETAVDQTWQWHEGNWVLVDERRSKGTPLTIFAEREETRHPYLPGLDAYREAHEIGEENKPDHRSRKARKK
jgi:hypothetical protein